VSNGGFLIDIRREILYNDLKCYTKETKEMKRKSGVLMHVSTLPGEYGIGSFGSQAKYFVDFLAESGFSYWQTLPFCMTDEYNSPYKSLASFGANPYFIDLPTLHAKGLLTDSELTQAAQNTPYLCEYDRLSRDRLPLLKKASQRVSQQEKVKIEAFLKSYPELALAAEFLALREKNADKPWQEWRESVPDAESLFAWQFIQYEFFMQWQEIKEYANSKGIKIIGDVPIYVALDSCDVWAHGDLFALDRDNRPKCVAGVPPDYFSKDGQLWGNPIYDWREMKKDGYAWWCERIKYMLTLFDGVRIDHFRGFEAFWSVPAGAKTAKEGKWVKGPGRALIDRIKEVAGDKLIIAEDLGDITPEVEKLLKYSAFPGMRVFQFAFLGDRESVHLPNNYDKNSVAYTGTHDNATLLSYTWEVTPEQRRAIFSYCGYDGEDKADGCRAIMRKMLASPADTVIFPIQDILIYGSDTRMNVPGVANGNWRYRLTKDQLDIIDRNKFKTWNRDCFRI